MVVITKVDTLFFLLRIIEMQREFYLDVYTILFEIN